MKCRNIPTFPFYWKLFFILMPLAWFLDRSHISPSRSPRFHSLGNNQRATLLSPSLLQISQLLSRSLLFNFRQLGRFHSPPKTSSLVHLFFPSHHFQTCHFLFLTPAPPALPLPATASKPPVLSLRQHFSHQHNCQPTASKPGDQF